MRLWTNNSRILACENVLEVFSLVPRGFPPLPKTPSTLVDSRCVLAIGVGDRVGDRRYDLIILI